MTPARQRISRAAHLIDLRRFDQARQELGHALSETPTDVEALLLLSHLELEDGQLEASADAATRAAAEAPDDVRCHLLLASALQGLNRDRAAVDAARAAVRLAPDEPMTFLWILMPGGLDDFFAQIGRPRTPGEPAPEPFPRPENVAEIERRTVFGWTDSSYDAKR